MGFLNQDGWDERIDQDLDLNQDSWDERMDQDHFGNVALEIPQNFRGLLHKPASCFEYIVGFYWRTGPLSKIMDDRV